MNERNFELIDDLFTGISQSRDLSGWWRSKISPLPPEEKKNFIDEFLPTLAGQGQSWFLINRTAPRFSDDPDAFQEIFSELVLPLHHRLVMSGGIDAALEVENMIYKSYIKQIEDWDFYETAFSQVYAPYRELCGPGNRLSGNSGSENRGPGDRMVFWIQTFNPLAHTTVLKTMLANLKFRPGSIFVSSVFGHGYDEEKSTYERLGVRIIKVHSYGSIAERCRRLMRACEEHRIRNIVFVSVPLQSGYFRSLSADITLTWWSMKFPLGCMGHFDRFVCNRSITSEVRDFNGQRWYCAPFAVSRLKGVDVPEGRKYRKPESDAMISVGVLARQEKLAASDLPEILGFSVANLPSVDLYWTGRSKDRLLEQRLHRPTGEDSSARIHFAGWVDPAVFLSEMDILIDTPNLGGVVAYQMMSLHKVVLSSGKSGSIGAIASPEVVERYFEILSSEAEVVSYFTEEPHRPFYLSSVDLIPICLYLYTENRPLIAVHGSLFGDFFDRHFSDQKKFAESTFGLLSGKAT